MCFDLMTNGDVNIKHINLIILFYFINLSSILYLNSSCDCRSNGAFASLAKISEFQKKISEKLIFIKFIIHNIKGIE